jgi:hypothetical protein
MIVENSSNILDRARKTPSPIDRHGYYIPADDLIAGDLGSSMIAKQIWQKMKLDIKFAQRFDSVSVWVRNDGAFMYRATLHNFFAITPQVFVMDLPLSHPLVNHGFLE